MQKSGRKSTPEFRSLVPRALKLIKRIVKWRILVIIFAAGLAWHTWESQWVPTAMIPCYDTYLHDPQKEAMDWQMSHPFMAGLYSGASLGLWPAGYAIPRGCSYVNEGAGIPPWTYTPFAHLAFPAFRAWATLFTALFVWVYAGLLLWAFRPVLSGLLDGWKNRKPSPLLPSKTLPMQHSPDSVESGSTGNRNPASSTSSGKGCPRL